MDDELKMKCYIWTTGLNRLTISGYTSSPMKGAPSPASSASRRIYCRALVSGMVLLVMLLPLIIFRISFLVLEPATARSLDCTEWSFFGDIDPSLLRDELTRTLVEVSEGKGIDVGAERSLNSFEDLVKDITSGVHDIKTFALKAKSMLSVMEHEVQTTRQHELVYWNLASHGVPRSLHCLCLILAEEYAINAMARSRLPSPEYVSRLSDPSFQHLVLLTDNVLAASVVVSSTIENSDNSENLVFHIVTDKKTYTPMHTWFAINHFEPAVVEVKGLHQYDWPQEVNVGVKEMLEIHNLIWNHYYNNLKEDVFEQEGERPRSYEMLSPSCLSLMNHLRIYLPELFPDLGKVLFLDDDVVVQRDLSSLWGLDLNGSVVGAVINSWCGHKCCTGRRYGDYFNFSNPIISSNLDHDQCGWSYGVNVFDLDAWRRSNITKTYHNWLKLSLNSGFELWYPGLLSPSLVAFEGYVHPIDPLWHVAGLGSRSLHVSKDILEAAAVIHFSGPAKPWLEIGFPEVRSLWNRYVNSSNEFIKKCGVMG